MWRVKDILNYTKITEVNLSVFVYRLLHEDFSTVLGTDLDLDYILGTNVDLDLFYCLSGEKSSRNSLQTNTDKLTSVICVHKAISIEHSTTWDSRINLNYIFQTIY